MSLSANEVRSFNQDHSGKTSLPIGILNACTPWAWKKVGGIPLVARSLFHLNALGLKRLVLFWDSENPPQNLEKWQGTLRVDLMEMSDGMPASLLKVANLGERFVYLDGSHLIDPKLLEALMLAQNTTLCCMDASDKSAQLIRAGFLDKDDLLLWSQGEYASLFSHASFLFPGDVQSFRPEIRGQATPYLLEISSDSDAERASHLLIRSQQKQVMDLPARYIHPPFENALTSLLLKTPISPDGVTAIVALVAFLVTWLFWHAYFLSGAFLSLVVDILDGVDGKLARTKLQFSWLGKHEDIIDYFYENSWYVALGVGLNTLTGSNLPLLCAALLVISDTADNIFYTLAGKWYGRSIDLFSRFDGSFRLIAGRRNIYGSLFIIGFSLGYVFQTFVIVTLWALITATIHGFRLRRYGENLERPRGEGKEPS